MVDALQVLLVIGLSEAVAVVVSVVIVDWLFYVWHSRQGKDCFVLRKWKWN